jgi:phosphohistidine swiveling domain-containing protein
MPEIDLKNIRTAAFWAREYRIPIFWLTAKKWFGGKISVIALYQDNVASFYIINDGAEKLDREGEVFFSNAKNIDEYRKTVKKILEESRGLQNKFQALNLHELSLPDLKKEFKSFLRAITDFADVYTMTEPACLETIDKIPGKKNQMLLTELGKRRLELRKVADKLFFSLMNKIIKELARRTKTKASDLFFYTHTELAKLFQGERMNLSVIKARQRGYALFDIPSYRKSIFCGKEYKRIVDHINSLQFRDEGVWQGKTAQPGVVEGVARVVRHNKSNLTRDIELFREGEILITEMTRPDTILACKKAAAIVTDEGGMTSHAAIISRELHIPCVIGTGEAYREIKTGDKILVDANKGIVKRL